MKTVYIQYFKQFKDLQELIEQKCRACDENEADLIQILSGASPKKQQSHLRQLSQSPIKSFQPESNPVQYRKKLSNNFLQPAPLVSTAKKRINKDDEKHQVSHGQPVQTQLNFKVASQKTSSIRMAQLYHQYSNQDLLETKLNEQHGERSQGVPGFDAIDPSLMRQDSLNQLSNRESRFQNNLQSNLLINVGRIGLPSGGYTPHISQSPQRVQSQMQHTATDQEMLINDNDQEYTHEFYSNTCSKNPSPTTSSIC